MRRCRLQLLNAVGGKKSIYERRLVALRNASSELLPKRPKDNLHVEYPAEEIARRMTKVRLRHQRAEDRLEKSMLAGEYKYFSGKKINFDDAQLPELIAILQNYAYFGLFSTVVMKETIAQIHGRVDDMTCGMIERTLRYLATLHKLPVGLLDDMSLRLLKQLPDLTPRELASIVEVMDYVQSESPALLHPLVMRCVDDLGRFSDEEVASLACVIARQPVRGKDVDRVCYAVLQRFQASLGDVTYDKDAAARTLWGLAVSGYLRTEHIPVVRRVASFVCGEGPSLAIAPSGTSLSFTLRALDAMSCFDEDAVMTVALSVQTNMDDLSMTEAAWSMRYLARSSLSENLGAVEDVVYDLLKHMTELNFMGETTAPTTLAMVLHSLALVTRLEDNKKSDVVRIARALSPHLPTLHLQELSEFFHACVVFPWMANEATQTLFLERLQDVVRFIPSVRREDYAMHLHLLEQCLRQLPYRSDEAKALVKKILYHVETLIASDSKI
eukprot:PhM_4_TR16023/c0_g1_i1/m.50345